MKRDPRLHGLTSDHHHALVLALRVKEAAAAGTLNPRWVAETRRRFETELRPHFVVEEEELLPAIAASRPDLVARTLREHGELRAHLEAAETGDLHRLEAFGLLLTAHVRFEEGELFAACEQLTTADALDRVAQRRPKPRDDRQPASGAED